MGLLLGKITVETPKYEVLHTCPDYEIRSYSPCVVAEVTYPTGHDRDAGFKILADYIGALGPPRNRRIEKIPMTAPVITAGEKIAMTAPVLTAGGKGGGEVTMRFVLPSSEYARADEAPAPLDERVAVRDEAAGKYAVARFSGVATEAAVAERVERLRRSLERDGRRVVGEYVLARYNPPWTLPPLRTNEVMLPVED
ncbi:heme-binding-like protein At3g10130, chloroplastic [Zingiber officinale]|uniref:SOUL heme-binding family protein n=1 Tax=Zingiber officinale TaxID=94328 RepID=A0A8J5FTB7_ZINOF|nr:heme-binding-like protein At3g10130, chloroplastic [Zingiber officinale]KAG6493949.1 hypothetical protein ZIOFF_048955 [Zingiber officinale]